MKAFVFWVVVIAVWPVLAAQEFVTNIWRNAQLWHRPWETEDEFIRRLQALTVKWQAEIEELRNRR